MSAADVALEKLRTLRPNAYRCHPTDPDRWLAQCPACDQPLVIIAEPRGVALMCVGGCEEGAVLAALKNAEPDPEHAAELVAQRVILDAHFERRARARRAEQEARAWS